MLCAKISTECRLIEYRETSRYCDSEMLGGVLRNASLRKKGRIMVQNAKKSEIEHYGFECRTTFSTKRSLGCAGIQIRGGGGRHKDLHPGTLQKASTGTSPNNPDPEREN